jgi:hypothetical protein
MEATRLAQHHRRVNCVPLLLALLVPWLLFIVVFMLVSFYCHYAAPVTMWLCVLILLAGCFGYLISHLRSKLGMDTRFYPLYFSVSCFAAVVFGVFFGALNFWEYMHAVYELDHLAAYNNVDPSSEKTLFGEVIPARGGRYQDAGFIYFNHKAFIDTSRSMSFKMGDLYCVAPIINPECNVSCGTDFWAVGVNCCSENAADFRCGDYNNPRAKSGIRLVHASWRPLFRLAVLQAVGAYHLESTQHPVFLNWVQDPVASVHYWQRSGYKKFVVAMFVSFFTNALALWIYLRTVGNQIGIPRRIK